MHTYTKSFNPQQVPQLIIQSLTRVDYDRTWVRGKQACMK